MWQGLFVQILLGVPWSLETGASSLSVQGGHFSHEAFMTYLGGERLRESHSDLSAFAVFLNSFTLKY